MSGDSTLREMTFGIAQFFDGIANAWFRLMSKRGVILSLGLLSACGEEPTLVDFSGVSPWATQALPAGFRTLDELLADFQTLQDDYPELVTQSSIGTSYQGRDIPVFSLGNPQGGRILFIGCTHGSEVDGPEVYFHMAKWLLERRESVAERILRRNLVSFLIVNVDSHGIKRKNQQLWGYVEGEPRRLYGVDLNRNMENGWETLDHASEDPAHNNYHGPSPASEPESQALMDFFESHRPEFVLDYHMGMDNWFAKPSRHAGLTAAEKAYHGDIAQRIRSLQAERGARVMTYGTMGISGSVAGQAHVSGGATAFLMEDGKRDCGYPYPPSAAELEGSYLDKALPFLLVFAAESEVELAVDSFTLIDADADLPITTHDPLVDGAVINLSDLPTMSLNVRANTNPAAVGSVTFDLDGAAHTESFVPYAMANEQNGDFHPWTPTLGMHTLTATPFSESGGAGSPGISLTITFEVVADCFDSDNDGYGSPASPGCVHDELDCDDASAVVNPGASEICDDNDRDEDCDGLADDEDPSAGGKATYFEDQDGDGYGAGDSNPFCDAPIGWVGIDDDCHDTDAAIHPSAVETCNGQDDDCDTEVDEDFDLSTSAEHCGACDSPCPGPDSCIGGVCVTSCEDEDGDGHTDASCGGTDCDDSDPKVSPDAADTCRRDNNCDGVIDKCEDDAKIVGGCSAHRSTAATLLATLVLLLRTRRGRLRMSCRRRTTHLSMGK
ncbi:M14 family zinc carboxypeptidase, partial [Myxococcota bacterium]